MVISGNNGSASGSEDLASAEVFDAASGQLSPSTSNLATARSGHQAFLLPKNNAILVLGGSSPGTDIYYFGIHLNDESWIYFQYGLK